MRISVLLFPAVLSIVIATVSLLHSAGSMWVALSADDEIVVNTSCIVINEVMYNPPQSGTDSAYEWFELYNNCAETIELVGWGIRDNGGYDVIPSMSISAYGFMVVAATENFSVNFPDYSGAIVFVGDGRIGNGLGNEGDRLILTDDGGNIIDALSYGSDTTINSSWMKKVAEGHSMERRPAGGTFQDNDNPTPGLGWPDVTPTPTPSPTPTPTPTPSFTPTPSPTPAPTPTPSPTPDPTATPTPTPTPSLTPTPSPTPSPEPTLTHTPTPTPTPVGTVASRGDVLINEVMYDPPQAGTDSAWEWFELYNACDETVELVGWGIRDNNGYDVIPPLNISSYGFAVIAASDRFFENHSEYDGTIVFIEDGKIGGNGLSNSGDRLILTDGSGQIIDELSYGTDDTITSSPMKKVGEGHSMERQPAGGSFIDNSEPTPGFGLPSPTPTPIPTPSLSPTPAVSPTPVTPGTVANRSDVLINEIQYNPPQSGSESAYEWLELYNNLDLAVSLSGWRISDNYSSDAIPLANISPHGFLVIAASTEFYENFPDYTGAIVFIDDGRIGNGLGNSGDCLILRDAEDNVIDALSYGDDDSITSTPFKKVGEGHSMERKPCGGLFADNDAPTPGHCLPEAIGYADAADVVPVSPVSDEGDSATAHQQQSADASLAATGKAHTASAQEKSGEFPGVSLSALLVTLSLSLISTLGWMLYRRKSG